MPKVLKAPVKKEQVVGKVKVYLEGKLLFSDDVLARDEVKSDSVLSYVKDVINNWFK